MATNVRGLFWSLRNSTSDIPEVLRGPGYTEHWMLVVGRVTAEAAVYHGNPERTFMVVVHQNPQAARATAVAMTTEWENVGNVLHHTPRTRKVLATDEAWLMENTPITSHVHVAEIAERVMNGTVLT